MNSINKILRVVAGVILVIIGIIGGLIPIFQGWIFGIPGLMLLGSVFPSVKIWTKKIVKKSKSKINKYFRLFFIYKLWHDPKASLKFLSNIFYHDFSIKMR